MNLIGYLTLYYKVYDDKKVMYGKIDFDFRKVPEKQLFDDLLVSFREMLDKSNPNVTAEYCTKEEYEENETKTVYMEVWP